MLSKLSAEYHPPHILDIYVHKSYKWSIEEVKIFKVFLYIRIHSYPILKVSEIDYSFFQRYTSISLPVSSLYYVFINSLCQCAHLRILTWIPIVMRVILLSSSSEYRIYFRDYLLNRLNDS